MPATLPKWLRYAFTHWRLLQELKNPNQSRKEGLFHRTYSLPQNTFSLCSLHNWRHCQGMQQTNPFLLQHWFAVPLPVISISHVELFRHDLIMLNMRELCPRSGPMRGVNHFEAPGLQGLGTLLPWAHRPLRLKILQRSTLWGDQGKLLPTVNQQANEDTFLDNFLFHISELFFWCFQN